jgi:hypothetical protein
VTESLMFASSLYTALGVAPETRLSVRVTHRGLAGRQLTSAGNRFVWPTPPTEADESQTEIVLVVGSIMETIVDDVRRLTAPLVMCSTCKNSTRRYIATSPSVSSRASRLRALVVQARWFKSAATTIRFAGVKESLKKSSAVAQAVL